MPPPSSSLPFSCKRWRCSGLDEEYLLPLLLLLLLLLVSSILPSVLFFAPPPRLLPLPSEPTRPRSLSRCFLWRLETCPWRLDARPSTAPADEEVRVVSCTARSVATPVVAVALLLLLFSLWCRVPPLLLLLLLCCCFDPEPASDDRSSLCHSLLGPCTRRWERGRPAVSDGSCCLPLSSAPE